MIFFFIKIYYNIFYYILSFALLLWQELRCAIKILVTFLQKCTMFLSENDLIDSLFLQNFCVTINTIKLKRTNMKKKKQSYILSL